MRRTNALTAILIAILLFTFVSPLQAQRPRPRPKTSPKPVVTQAPSFDNLLSADIYKIYVEIKNVGQLLSSSAVNELLEPVLKLAGPPKEFRTAVKWLMSHTEPVMTSRMLLATWPTTRNVPDVLIAIEFDNAEEAAQFEPQLNEFLPKVLPPAVSQPSPGPTVDGARTNQNSAQPPTQADPKPTFVVTRAGSLVFITNAALTLKNLRPLNSKPLTEDQNFRTAYDRLSSEPIFAFLNLKAMQKDEEDSRQKAIEERKREENTKRVAVPENQETQPEQPQPGQPEESTPKNEALPAVVGVPQPPDPLTLAMTQLVGVFFSGSTESKWPEAIGFGANLDLSALDVRALLVNPPTEKTSAIPFFPLLMSGPSIVPESPGILPADTELFVVMSLDLPQIYSAVSTKP
ncbi:MAG TPA: hypothetical protein VF074_03335, partial [Pyrinomonadaceae bacterium]